MIGGLTSLFVAIVLGWTGYALLGLFFAPTLSALIGAAIGLLCMTLIKDTVAIRGFVAVMEPIGIVLPLLALRHVAIGLGVPMVPFSTPEMMVFLLAYVAFLAASMGVLPVEAYRLGYAPWPVAVMVLVVCVYGTITGNWFVPMVAVAGQFLWVMGWGSSNWFDHILHAMLVPVVLVALVLSVR